MLTAEVYFNRKEDISKVRSYTVTSQKLHKAYFTLDDNKKAKCFGNRVDDG